MICVGSGGVGKTTLSASLGICAAQLGLKTLVMTIDPSRRLKVALGVDSSTVKPVRVPGQKYSGELWACLLNAEEIFRDFIINSSTNPELAQQLLKNRLYQQLSTTLSGSQEFTSLLQLTKITQEQNYDLIILDTPPAQHAIDFLEAPEKIRALFQDRVVRWFVGEEEGSSFIQKIIARSTHIVLSALERITGSTFMKELNHFFATVRTVQAKISERTEIVQEILHAESTGFLLVTGFDEAKLREAEALFGYLDSNKYHLRGAFINRAFVPALRPLPAATEPKLVAEYAQWATFYQSREVFFQDFTEKWQARVPVVRLPELSQDTSGLDGLEVFAHEMGSAYTQQNGHNNVSTNHKPGAERVQPR